MQNNVTDLTQKLLRSLDSNYNVTDMPTVIDVISLLEKVSITKELLETTRLGRHVNELRRNTTNASLAKRAKELVKKWRNLVLPESNGQLKQSSDDSNQEEVKNKKRPIKDKVDSTSAKRTRLNGTNELDFSDNSNSSFKEVLHAIAKDGKKDVILINSDSNSSLHDCKHDPVLELQQPKKRGRKKGSKNHRNLLDEAESSFSNKMAVSRGNAKVKTTQELIASLQNKNTTNPINLSSPTKSKDDLKERAAKLTERVSIIDQKLNTSATRYKSSQKKVGGKSEVRNDRVFESGSFSNIKETVANSTHTDDEIIVVDEEVDVKIESVKDEVQEQLPKSLSVEEVLCRLPPVVEVEPESEITCTCVLNERKKDFSVEDAAEATEDKFQFMEDCNCPAKSYLEEKYHLGTVTDERVSKLHDSFIPTVNGNFSVGECKHRPELQENGLFVNVVPNRNRERIPKCFETEFSCENFKKYSISDGGEEKGASESTVGVECAVTSDKSDERDESFREWHEIVETPSYNGEILKILPYVIID